MNDLSEKILEIASQDGEFAEKLNAAETPEAVIALLAEKGIDVTAEDLQALAQPAEGAVKLADDELDEVAGGKVCYCVAGGGGVKGKNDRTCWCIVAGCGTSAARPKGSDDRCVCAGAGVGDSDD